MWIISVLRDKRGIHLSCCFLLSEKLRLISTRWASHMSWDESFYPAPEDVSSLYLQQLLELVIYRARPCLKITQKGAKVIDFSLFYP